MILLSNECYVKESCSKYARDKSCEECGIYCPRLHKLDELYNLSLLTPTQRKYVPMKKANDELAEKKLNDIIYNVQYFVESGNSAYLYSKICGNGKTTWAINIMKAYFNKIWATSDIECRGLFINVPTYLIQLKSSFDKRNDYIDAVHERILKADIVIFDEIGSKVGTQFEIEQLLNIINARINDGKSNIFTSNLGYNELVEAVGERLASRVFDLSTCIHFTAPNYRHFKICTDNNPEFKGGGKR